jgi:hypothetical protein
VPSYSKYLDPDDKVIEAIRPHIMSILPFFSAVIVLGLAVLYGVYALGLYGAGVSTGYALLGLVALLIFVIILGYATLRVYLNTFFIVTDDCFIYIHQKSITSRNVPRFSKSELTDVAAIQKGFLASAFNYGDVVLETAGDREEIRFKFAPDPQDLARRCMPQSPDHKPEEPEEQHPSFTIES